AKPFRRSIGGETSCQWPPPSVVMSSGLELSSLAHPTFGLRKYTLSTLCASSASAVVASSRLKLPGREEDRVNGEAALALAASISVMAIAAIAPSFGTVLSSERLGRCFECRSHVLLAQSWRRYGEQPVLFDTRCGCSSRQQQGVASRFDTDWVTPD